LLNEGEVKDVEEADFSEADFALAKAIVLDPKTRQTKRQ
jgi:hypothetical protein